MSDFSDITEITIKSKDIQLPEKFISLLGINRSELVGGEHISSSLLELKISRAHSTVLSSKLFIIKVLNFMPCSFVFQILFTLFVISSSTLYIVVNGDHDYRREHHGGVGYSFAKFSGPVSGM